MFRISATYEMRTTEYNGILDFNDNHTIGEKGFYIKRKEEGREQTARETEREHACVCECRSAPKIVSVDIHKQMWDRNTFAYN